MVRTAALACLLLALVPAAAAAASRSATARALAAQMRSAGSGSGALVVDLDTGDQIYALRAGTPRMPASVQKLYTSATTLRRLGASGRLTTTRARRDAARRGRRRARRPLPAGRRRPDVRRPRLQPARPAGRRRGRRLGHRARDRRRDGVRRAPRRAVVGVPADVRGRAALGADLQPRPDGAALALLAEPARELRRRPVHEAAPGPRGRRRPRGAPRPHRGRPPSRSARGARSP